MTRAAGIAPNHSVIKTYYRDMQEIRGQHVTNELAVRQPFLRLLEDTARQHDWTVISEISLKSGGRLVRPDATLRDRNSLPRGYWEAKDSHDDLEVEIGRKRDRGYPLANIIFEDTRRAVLYQNKEAVFTADLSRPQELADLLNRFYNHVEPDIEEFESAVATFQERVPELAAGLKLKIDEAHTKNRNFQEAWNTFFGLCRLSLNPNITKETVDEMLVQHLLTERLIREIFRNSSFVRQNVIAREIENVITALCSRSFSREEFLATLDPFFGSIERAARTVPDWSEKQHFLNSVYERFFQGYSKHTADTHGIVYTPQPIVDFMCASVERVLKEDFGKTLGSPGVNILDPCTGTGNFIVNLIRRIPARDLRRMYQEQLFANEVMLLPYYIAALNIEHEYYERTGEYEEFPGLCFVDTLDLAEDRQLPMFTEENTDRVKRQREAPITVIIGNPPYNVGQQNENDNNKNRKYPVIDRRIKETYAKDSQATNKNALSDAYVKFFRWASDRLGNRDGIVCFVSNNSFVDQVAMDGMRKHLLQDFSHIDHIDLHGNVRRNPKLSGTIHNVFGIQTGVGITVAQRRTGERPRLRYYRVPEFWTKFEKLEWLTKGPVQWKTVVPDAQGNWLIPENAREYGAFHSMREIFGTWTVGVKTNRDEVVYDFQLGNLERRVRQFIDDYNAEVDRYHRKGGKQDVDAFVSYDRIKWSRDLKLDLKRRHYASLDESKFRLSYYRPFTKRHLFFDRILNEEVYIVEEVFPQPETRNIIICCTNHTQIPFAAQITDCIPNEAPGGRQGQCFPFYFNNQENITDAALAQFRAHYANPAITKWDIFHYVYGILHHPGYREKYADNLKRELPRIPLAPEFTAFACAGRELARLHLDYEKLQAWPLTWVENKNVPLNWRVEKMRYLDKEKTSLKVNDWLTLSGIPPEVQEYRLGNRSALDWVVDQYQVSEDKRSGIKSDPNREDDREYIVRLVGQVVRVSLETVRIVNALPPFE